MNNTNIIMIGRTGDGKSSFCNLLSKFLGSNTSPFTEGNLAQSQTAEPISFIYSQITIIDTPGLMDPSGQARDMINIERIVNFSRSIHYVNGVILVMNYLVPRFDAGMQDALKLYIDSYGRDVLLHLGIVYTRCAELADPEMSLLQNRHLEIINDINQRCQTNITPQDVKFWIVDCHPEILSRRHVPSTVIERYGRNTEGQVRDMLSWARSKQMYSTDDAVLGEYEHARATRLMREEAEREQALRAVEERERIAAQQRAAQEQHAREEEERQRQAAQHAAEEANRRRQAEEAERVRAEAEVVEHRRRLEEEERKRIEIQNRPAPPPVYHYSGGGGGRLCVIM